MKKLIPLLFLSLLGSSFINAQSTVSDSIFYGNMFRNYRLYVPAAYTGNTAVPLVLNLHGYSSDNLEQQFYSNFMPIADTANFLILMPNGTFDAQNNRFWNSFVPLGNGVDDLGFLSALIDSISAAYNINQNRIYSTGMSNGGFMSYDLACFLSNRITAVASVTGSMSVFHYPACSPQHPTPVMQIHGTSDMTVPFVGGGGFEPIDTVVRYWVNFNNCNTVPVMTPVPDVNTTDFCTADHYVYNGGTAGSTVEFYKINNGGHSWPGAIPVVQLGNTNQDFSASKEIWRFFSQYSLQNLMSVPENNQTSVSIYPNPANSSFNISLNSFQGMCSINVYNVSGEMIESIAVHSSNGLLNIPATSWSKGFYMITVSDDSGNFSSASLILQ